MINPNKGHKRSDYIVPEIFLGAEGVVGPGDRAKGLGVLKELPPPPIYPREILTTSPSHRQVSKNLLRRSVFLPSGEFVPHSGAGSAWLAKHPRTGGGSAAVCGEASYTFIRKILHINKKV